MSEIHRHSSRIITGKGIADQDRNILSNQVLILGFLRSSVNYLAVGSIPYLQGTKRKRKTHYEDEDEDDAEQEEEMDADRTQDVAGKRGTVLITLRNVAPYTQW